MKIVLYILSVQCLLACESNQQSKLVFPGAIYEKIQWSQDELKEAIAIRHLHRGQDASTHLIRLKGNESPHYHDRLA